MHYGLDIGGTKIELAAFDHDLNPLDSWRVKTPKQNYKKFLSVISEMVKETDDKYGTLGTVGIGLPGVLDQNGQMLSANIPCLNQQFLLKDLTELLSRNVEFENDANTLVLSESMGGAGEGADILLGVILGTGVAGGLSIDGELYKSKRNLACEFGHIPLASVSQQRYDFPLRPCGCGLTACADLYLSGPGLLWMSSHFEADYSSVPELVSAVLKGESRAETVFSAYIDCLACYFAALTLMYDPDVIVIGGGLSNIDLIFQRLPEAMSSYLFVNVAPPAIYPPKFGDSSGVRGAALQGRVAVSGDS